VGMIVIMRVIVSAVVAVTMVVIVVVTLGHGMLPENRGAGELGQSKACRLNLHPSATVLTRAVFASRDGSESHQSGSGTDLFQRV
jgi:hypothetical protein